MDRHDTLLIVTASPDNRKSLRNILSGRYNLLEAGSEKQAMVLLRQNTDCIAALLLDFTRPEQLNRGELEQGENLELLTKVPVILLCREENPGIFTSAFQYGAADVIPLRYDPSALLHRVENVTELYRHKQYLEVMLREQAAKLRNTNENVVDVLSSIIEYRSVESGQHILRIRHFTRILLEEVARCCPEYQLDENLIAIISSAAALHDIGKIAIPDAILMKPGPLTDPEREIMKTHAATGCQILASLGSMTDPEYMRYAHNICHYHHERWDGGGYPEGLAGNDIPICAQVVGLADVYDALTSKRVYKEAFSFTRAVNMILKGECGQFSPKLLECFKHVVGAFEKQAKAYADGLSPRQETLDVTLPPPEQQENSLERLRSKYYALMHYIGAMLIEVDLDTGVMHLIYNPFPELAWLQEITDYENLIQSLSQRVLRQEAQENMVDFFHREVREFADANLRRLTRSFEMDTRLYPEGGSLEITLLRTNTVHTQRRTAAILCRRVASRPQSQEQPGMLSDSTFICRNDNNFTLVRLGRQVPMLAGYTLEELQSRFGNQLMQLVLPEEREGVRRTLTQALSGSTTAETEFRIRHKDGSVHWILDRVRLEVGPDGREYLNSFLTDISHTKKAYDNLREKLDRYEIILAQTENVLFEWDVRQNRLNLSDTWEKIFGQRPEEGSPLSDSMFHPDDLPLFIDSIGALKNGSQYEMLEARIVNARGRYIWCRLRISAIRDHLGQLQKMVGIIINIDAEKQAEQQLQDRAQRDSLTKLLNKNAARQQAEEYLNRFPEGAPCAMLIIDLDNFKQVNDLHGHLFGDAVLTHTAREISKLFRNQDIVARIGGDEFLVLMRGVTERSLLENRCQRLLQNLQNIFKNQRQKLPLSCSIGIAVSPEDGTSYYDLFNRADQALYQAKARGKNDFAFYEKKSEAFPLQAETRQSAHTPIDSDREPGLAEDNIVRHAFQRLYAARDVEAAVQDILNMIGQKMNVSRVYVFENSDDNTTCSNTYEWCNQGITAEKENLQHIHYERDIPGYKDLFDEQGIFYCPDVTALPRKYRDILEPQGIRSMLQCAIREGGAFRGYIGFDECVEQRFWTKEQIRTLTYFAEMLSVFLLKRRQQEKAVARADALHTILDNQNAWIYIIDPDTCQLKYLNAKTRELAPEVQEGMTCYGSLMGMPERCAGCPSRNIRREKNASALLHNPRFDLHVLAEATLIQWEQEESCLMTCRQLPKKDT